MFQRFLIILFFVILIITPLGCRITGIQADSPTPGEGNSSTNDIVDQTPLPGVILTQSLPEPSNTPIPPTATMTVAPTAGPDYFSQSLRLGNYSYVIPLSVRHVTQNSATLFFELSEPVDGRLVFRSANPENPFQGEVLFSAEDTRHMITLDNLVPGVQYQALVLFGTDGLDISQPAYNETAWGSVSFHTASDQSPIRVGVMGDASFGDAATQELINLMTGKDLDFVISTGDVVYETDSSDLVNSYLLKFYEPFSPLLHQMPVYTVLGNHDYDSVLRWGGAPFYDYAFPAFPDYSFSYPSSRRANQYYAIAYQDVQFLMLDSQVLFGVEGRADQETWMNERLSDPRYRISIPVFHVAPYSSSVVHPDDSLPVRYSWLQFFETANVPISFSGHFHHYERLLANGITYIVSGGGSSILYAQGNLLAESQIYVRRTHFVMMEIYADHIELMAIAKEGDVIDQVLIPLK